VVDFAVAKERHAQHKTHISAMDDEELQRLYTWIDEIPLTRPKRNITRDFADGGWRE
jgi:hypothetical protein